MIHIAALIVSACVIGVFCLYVALAIAGCVFFLKVR